MSVQWGEITFDHYRSFKCCGSQFRLYIGKPSSSQLPPASVAGVLVESFLKIFEKKLTRFSPDSELSKLNNSENKAVTVSPLLKLAVSTSLKAASISDGLVDPTVLPDMEKIGYKDSRADKVPESITAALAAQKVVAPASPSQEGRWREIKVDTTRSVVSRPPGIKIDLGGTGKGLAADLALKRLQYYSPVIVDCGGDLRISSDPGSPIEIMIEDPLSGGAFTSFDIEQGAVASSGIATRLWKLDDGRYMHHLLDPSTGLPAWTGVVQATAIAATTVEAETLAKVALLNGKDAKKTLAGRGGVVVFNDGSSEVVDVATSNESQQCSVS